MKRVPLRQHSPEWDRWRSEGLGASDGPALVGVSPYLTTEKLWEQKTGQASWSQSGHATRWGQSKEPEARRLWEDRTGQIFQPACVEHPDYPWLRASLD